MRRVADAKREAAKPKVVSLVDQNFPVQTAFVRDPALRKSAFTDRRAGKSTGSGILLLERGFEHPNTEGLYVALTGDSAKAIMLPIFRELNLKHSLGLEVPENGTQIRLPNDSIITLFGADSHQKLADRILGRKLNAGVIDEGASWRTNVRQLAYQAIEPALSDLEGPLAITGTPGDVAYGLFFDITTGKEKGWSRHDWYAKDNPYTAKQTAKKIARLIADDPTVVLQPWFRRMYRREWVMDDESLVYRFRPEKCFYADPKAVPKDLTYLLGIDLGFNDDTAFIILGYGPHDPHLYLVYAYKKPKMDLFDVVDHIVQLQESFDFENIVIDNASKQSVETMKNRFHIPLTAADKADKQHFIQLLNADMARGYVQIPENGADALVLEWANLTKKWNILHTKWEEDPQYPNHLADAFLYAWRKARHFDATPEAKRPPLPGSPEFFSALEKRIEDEAERAYRISKGEEETEELEQPDWADDE